MSNYRLLKRKAIQELSQLQLSLTESTKQLSENKQLEIKNRIEEIELQYCL